MTRREFVKWLVGALVLWAIGAWGLLYITSRKLTYAKPTNSYPGKVRELNPTDASTISPDRG